MADYDDLSEIISFEGFDFTDWKNGEEKILKPRMREKGFGGVRFIMGEKDSFGPLTRICVCVGPDGRKRRFIYG